MIDVARQAGVLILVVEDNEINQFVIGRLLDRLGFAYELAENGEKAIEKLSAGSYGLALIDIHMPVMNGFELAKLARR
ncbi:response regulator [Alphaproteobacteria bacterium]|nr:response regulator [Alphaproteobacteria bacterium]